MGERITQTVGKSLDEIDAGAPPPVTHDANFTPGYLRFAVERSLERLRTDRIDLLQLHNPPLQLISAMGTYEPLEEVKRVGLIRLYGVSVHPPVDVLAAIDDTMPDTILIVFYMA